MKHKHVNNIRLLAAALSAALVIIIAGCGAFIAYSHLMERRLFQASADFIEETYAGVAQIFDELTTARWNYLDQISQYLAATENDTQAAKRLIERVKPDYGFTDFYLMSDNGGYITLDGENGYIDLGDALFDLIDTQERIVVDGSLPGHDNMLFYAVPTQGGVYDGFSYCAVAFGYDKQDLAQAMNVSLYDGENDTYLIYPNGRVCLTMGTVKHDVRNFLYLLEDSGVSSEELERVRQDFAAGDTNTLTIYIEGIEYYMSYQPAKAAGWRLVSLTPASVADMSIEEIRKSTLLMLGASFGTILLLLASVGIYLVRRTIKNRNSLLAERELIFEVMSKDMNEIYLLYDTQKSAMRYVSPNVERMLGWTPQEVYNGSNVLNRCVENAGAWDKPDYLEQVAPGASMHREYNLRNHRSGEIRPYMLDLYRPAGKNAHLLVVSLTDNTNEYRIRQEIADAMESARAANAAKSVFLSNMSHDIRTPLNAIIGFAKLLERDADQPDMVHRYTGKIHSSGMHLLELINDVLDMSKIETGKTVLNLEPVNIADVITQISDMMRPMAEAKQQTFEVRVDTTAEESVMADRLRLVQILQNLLSNAIKYTGEKGRIELHILHMAMQEDKEFSRYRFIVKDNGIGMSEEYLQKIFEPFSREVNSTVNKIQGTGLGMPITRNLIDLMGGTINITSRPQEGSTFEVVLDFRVAERAEVSERAEAIKPSLNMQGMNILAAEDNEFNAEILSELLHMEGAQCTIAQNGQEVLDKFEAAAPQEYDFILMDVQMPVMNGYDATRAIRASAKNPEGAVIPIFAMTANAFSEDVQEALGAGMNAHLAKPLNMDTLKQTIRQFL